MVIIFNGDYIETMNIKNLLDSSGIESFIENEFMSTIKPFLVTAGGFNPVSLTVNNDDFEKAKKIIDDYNQGALKVDS